MTTTYPESITATCLTHAARYAADAAEDTFEKRVAYGVENGFDSADEYATYELNGDAGDEARRLGIGLDTMRTLLKQAYDRSEHGDFYR